MEGVFTAERVARSRNRRQHRRPLRTRNAFLGRRTMAEQKKKKRKPNPAFMKPMQPDAQLSAVVGDRPMPRTEVTKKIWDYIKKNSLQDSKNKRMINADEKLKAVFNGKRQVSMFEMTKLVNGHLKDTR